MVDWPETAKATAPLMSWGLAEIGFLHVIQWLTADFSLETKINSLHTSIISSSSKSSYKNSKLTTQIWSDRVLNQLHIYTTN